jgi:MFS family permease
MWNIFFLGLVSFFMDVSTEMVYPVIPLYLTSAFGATPVLVGLIEGLAESLASLLKVLSGYITDKFKNKKLVAFLGYATSLVYKIALLLSGSWAGILGARVIDRIGKGIRTAPRDVMISESAKEGKGGFAFGLHKALDMLGAAIGILLAFFLVQSAGGEAQYRRIFLVSIIPAVLSLLMFIRVREKKNLGSKSAVPFWRGGQKLNSQLKLYLVVALVFTLGNSSNAFLLLRAKSVGFDDQTVILLYFVYNITASILSIPAGRLSDRIGRKRVLVIGYVVFSLVYFGFAFVSNQGALVALFVLYGLYTAMIAGVERAFIAEIAPPERKGTLLGLHSTIVGVALFPASAIAGLLWDVIGAWAPFVFGASLSLTAALILLFFLKDPRKDPARIGNTGA